MPQPNVYWFYNQGTNDVPKTPGVGEDANFRLIGAGHVLFWTGNGAMDGAPTNTRDTIKIPVSGSKEIPKTFIDNGSTIEQVPLAGTNQGGQNGGATRYVFCVHIDGPTVSRVFLEFWDNVNHDTINSQCLGKGNPDNSYVKGITTTYGPPNNPDWVGNNEYKNLGGNGVNNRLELSDAPLPGPAALYFNLAVRIPGTATPFAEVPIATVRFAYA
jgi:hypothetical protein